tara:strand:- start:911 stop:1366 length:456 start_codon:yes stop_codon:yes gene_type:complete
MNKILLIAFLFLMMYAPAYADCTGCGDDGHQVCPIEEKAHKHITVMTEEHKTSTSQPEDGVVFAVCIFEIDNDTGERKLVDHRASENLMDCLKNKREAERDYKEQKEKGGVFNMTCDKVNAKVQVQEDGSWKILEILGRHEQAYIRKKVYE